MNTSSFSLFHHPAVLPFIIHSKWRSHRLLGAAFVILSSLSLSAAQYPSYTVVDIGTFGGARSLAYDLNNLDEVVGEAWTTGDASTRAFLFSTNTLTDLGTLPGGTDAYAYGINDFSVIVGADYHLTDLAPYPLPRAWIFRYGRMDYLGKLDDTVGGSAQAINNQNQVVGNSYVIADGLPLPAFFWSDGSMQSLGTLRDFGSSEVTDINDSGVSVGSADIIVPECGFNVGHAVRFSGSPVDIVDRNTFQVCEQSSALRINNAGHIVGVANFFDTTVMPARSYHLGWINISGFELLPTLGGSSSGASGINNHDAVVGNADTGSGATHGILYTNGTMVDLNDLIPSGTGWEVVYAETINDLGQIAANGRKDGAFHALLLDRRVKGIDISYHQGSPGAGFFGTVKNSGFEFVVMQGRACVHGRSEFAHQQAQDARAAGLLTAGYCYLTFASDINGACQIREAIYAFGDEAPYLGFMAVDVEKYSDACLPAGLTGNSPDPDAQHAAISRIQEAIDEIRKAGLRPVLYTDGPSWRQITDDTQAFADVPLWRTQAGSEPDQDVPALDFGGWNKVHGKQYVLGTHLGGVQVDYDIFDLSVFSKRNVNFNPPQLRLDFLRNGNGVRLFWSDCDVVLERADNPSGPWTPVSSATSSYDVIVSGQAPVSMFRLRR